MGKKSYLSVGKFFTIAAMFISSMILFTGCESQEDVERKFRSEIRENFTRQKASTPYLDGIFFKDVKITEEDGDDYKLDIEKGIGNITVDGASVSNIKEQGNGNNSIEVSGGIGAINLKFKESDAK